MMFGVKSPLQRVILPRLGWAALLILAAGATGQAGTLYVADSGSIHSIDTLSKQVSLFATINGPDFIAISPQGNLYVSVGSQIEEYSPSGQDLGAFATGLSTPQGLAFDSSGNLYVALSGTGSVEKFNSSGLGATFATGLGYPVGIAINSQGNVFVSSFSVSNSQVNVFDSSGTNKLTLSLGSSGPGGLTFDAAGDLFVANQLSFNVEEYAASGGLVSTSGTNYASTGSNSQPTGLAFDGSGNLYVSYAYQTTSVIEEFTAPNTGTTFASGFNIPIGVAYSAVPEPSAAALLGGAGVGALLMRRRRAVR